MVEACKSLDDEEVAFVADHRRVVGVQTTGHLLGHRVEHRRRLRLAGNQFRHPAQRRLLSSQLTQAVAAGVQLFTRRRIGDRGGHQIGEVCDAYLCVGRQRLVPRGHGGHAPQLCPDHDRDADHGFDAHLADACRRNARRMLVAVHPSGPAGAPNRHGDVVAVQREPLTDGRRVWKVNLRTPERGDDDVIAVVAGHRRVVDVQNIGHLLGHRAEHLGRLRLAGDQFRHPAQRRLMPGELTQAIAAGTQALPAGIQLLARRGIGDRGSHQIGEVCDARLGIGRQRFPLRGAGRKHPPDPAIDDDRNT